MVRSSSFDVAVIGAGMGGYVAAIRSAQLGRSVSLIEKEELGGTCVNWGCIPTETLLVVTDLIYKIKRSEEFGLHIEGLSTDFKRIMERKDAIVNRLVKGLNFLIKKNNIELIRGRGILLSRNQVHVEKVEGAEETINAENIIIAAGSEPSKPRYADVDEEKIMTTNGALKLTEVPQSMVIIGGETMGVEFAQIFNALGTDVKIFESSQRIFPSLDKDLGMAFQMILKRNGVEINTRIGVESVKIGADGKVRVSAVSNGSPLIMEAEKVLITDNRKPLTNNLGLEKVGVHLKDGFINVDEHMRTGVPGIYAVGDVTGGKMFAHVAAAGGIVAAENIAGIESTIDYKTIPTCVYSSPEIASVGLSEEEASLQGHSVIVGRFPLLANGRALTLGEKEGFVKIVCDKETGEVLGVHMIAPHATEMIGEASLALKLECTYEEISSLIHAHPTLSEAIMEAAKAVAKKAIHI